MDRDELLGFLDNLENIEDEDARYTELFRKAEEMRQEYLASLNNDDYEIDPAEMEHFTDLAAYMMDLAKRNGGKCQISTDQPKEGGADIVAYFPVFTLIGEINVATFCKFLCWATSVSIDALTDGTVCVSIRFSGVYRRKAGK